MRLCCQSRCLKIPFLSICTMFVQCNLNVVWSLLVSVSCLYLWNFEFGG
uniref:Uncharacterized protein n=1 Tax=Rhizophora mucronata TaxID=61149 RepID=A0A2P2IHQ7_RHIMU